MDVKQYFRKLREIESTLEDDYPVIVSTETPDGGKAGFVSEVSRQNAAKLIAEGRAVLAGDEQKTTFRKGQMEAIRAAQNAERARQFQFAVLSESELQSQLLDRKNRNGKG
jgi:hypothetical protein